MFNIQIRMRINAQQQIYMDFGGRERGGGGEKGISGKHSLPTLYGISGISDILVSCVVNAHENIVLYPGNEPVI